MARKKVSCLLIEAFVICNLFLYSDQKCALGAPQTQGSKTIIQVHHQESQYPGASSSANPNAGPPVANSLLNTEKTADLSLLINETLSINKKSVPNNLDKLMTKDDWTFDRVEYDLMEFLQDLSTRYRLANDNKTLTDDSMQGLEGKVVRKNAITKVKEDEPITDTSPRPADDSKMTTARSVVTSTPELPPISLASGDHDIAESTWQYGIFDRFTRPRSTPKTSTTTTPDPIASSGSGSNLEVKNFNSDECGLRTYEDNSRNFAQNLFENDDQASKELNQRRQRPPPGSSFFMSHKKHQSTGLADDFLNDELDMRRPQLEGYGEPQQNANDDSKQSTPTSDTMPSDSEASPTTISENLGDNEFNLSLRRQWLQQQLGHTLKMLGFNASTLASSEFSNQTSGSSLNFRENMMKMSNKVGKSMQLGKFHHLIDYNNQPEINEQALKARQDELKLEARVIGGSDARLGDSPWSVSLQALVSRPGTGVVEYRHYCGGTIISEYYILTAAHCLDFMVGRESRLFVVVGDLNWRMSAGSLHGRRFGVDKLIIHSGYKSTAFGHDIGLIKTKESMQPLKVNGKYIINSVCLPEYGVEHSGEAELVGWGLFSNRNEMADSLQIADVPILPRPLCVDLYRRRTGLIQWLIGIELITEKQICAGTFGRGICQGDSGSALVFNEKVSRTHVGTDGRAVLRKSNTARDHQNRATIIGIVAFGGIRRCSYQSLPGVYMQTSKYMDWILPRIQK